MQVIMWTGHAFNGSHMPAMRCHKGNACEKTCIRLLRNKWIDIFQRKFNALSRSLVRMESAVMADGFQGGGRDVKIRGGLALYAPVHA